VKFKREFQIVSREREFSGGFLGSTPYVELVQDIASYQRATASGNPTHLSWDDREMKMDFVRSLLRH